tara:strand:- start:6805 stop:6930 length:126 start_codon:yes stop_codon:yes gene_type:complete
MKNKFVEIVVAKNILGGGNLKLLFTVIHNILKIKKLWLIKI